MCRNTQTKGVWLWGEPDIVSQGPGGVTTAIIYVDTEGFESTGKSDAYDDRIFALSAIISSLLVYPRFPAPMSLHCPQHCVPRTVLQSFHWADELSAEAPGKLVKWSKTCKDAHAARCTICRRQCARAMWRS